jgi:hypothetical protein
MPPSNETETDGLAVAVVLTLELAKIASVIVRLDHVASDMANANHSVIFKVNSMAGYRDASV